MSVVLQINKSLYPLLIKPLYDLLEKQKNNWLIIKIIKLFDKILRLEPRMIKKLVDPYTKMLRSTSAKSIEFELLSSIIRHFQEHKSLYSLACENLKSFINHTDANLRSLGLSCLKSMLSNNENMLSDYKDYLIESLKKADLPTKRQILEIFHLFVKKDLLEDIVCELLQYLEDSPARQVDEKLKENVIETILKVCKKDNFIHIEDFEWLLFEVLGKLMRKVMNVNLAKELSATLMTLILRVEDLKSCIQKFCINTLMGFDEIAVEQQSFSEIQVNIQGRTQKKQEISAKEIIFQTLVFLAGEYTEECRIPSEIFSLLEFFNNEKLLFLYSNSFHLIKVSVFKLSVALSALLVDSPQEKMKGSLEKIQSLHVKGLENDYILGALTKILAFSLGLLQKMLKINQGAIFNHSSSNFLMNFFFSAISLDLKALLLISSEDLEKKLLESSTPQNLKKLAELKDLFSNELRPVHAEAQKYIVVPEGLELSAPIQIDEKELVLVNETKKEWDLEEKPKEKTRIKKKKEEKKEFEETKPTDSEIKEETNIERILAEEVENNENMEEKKEQKIKKEYKLNVEDYLPPGVTLDQTKEVKDVKTKKKKEKTKADL